MGLAYTNRLTVKRRFSRIRFAHGGLEGRRYGEGAMLYLKTGFFPVYAMNVAADFRRNSDTPHRRLRSGGNLPPQTLHIRTASS